MYCNHCGARIDDTSVYCSHCGAKLPDLSGYGNRMHYEDDYYDDDEPEPLLSDDYSYEEPEVKDYSPEKSTRTNDSSARSGRTNHSSAKSAGAGYSDASDKPYGYYQNIWNERKQMTKTSLIIGAVIGAVLGLILAASSGDSFSFEAFAEGFVIFTILFTPAVIVVRAIHAGKHGAGFAAAGVGLLLSLGGMMLSDLRYNSLFGIIVFGIFAMIYGIIFFAIALFYVFYVPISDVYYWVKAGQEKKAYTY